MGAEDIVRPIQQCVSDEAARGRGRTCNIWIPNAQGCAKRGTQGLGRQCGDHVLHNWDRSRTHPYPLLVRDFNSVIGHETREQMLEQTGRLPDVVVACVGGGSNAMGIFHPFIDDEGVELHGVEAAGEGIETGRHAAPLCAGKVGVLHGQRTYLMEDENGQIIETHSVSAGLDYPGVGPEHAWLKDIGRATYVAATDQEALAAFHSMTRLEGIIPALESSHAVAHAMQLASTMPADRSIVVNLSGRGDKDMGTVAEIEGITI